MGLAASPAQRAKACRRCGVEFVPRHGAHRYCSRRCSLEITRACVVCKKGFVARKDQSTRYCSFACRETDRHGVKRQIRCVECGTVFQDRRRSRRKFCSHACATKHRWNKPNYELGWRLKVKGETTCRNCGQEARHLHHIVPKSKSALGKTDVLRNGLPLCADCHRGWHHHTTTIYMTALREEELINAINLAGLLWVEEHYPYPPDMRLRAMYALKVGDHFENQLKYGRCDEHPDTALADCPCLTADKTRRQHIGIVSAYRRITGERL